MDDLTKSINKLSELISGSSLVGDQVRPGVFKDTTNFQIGVEEGVHNIKPISETAKAREQA